MRLDAWVALESYGAALGRVFAKFNGCKMIRSPGAACKQTEFVNRTAVRGSISWKRSRSCTTLWTPRCAIAKSTTWTISAAETDEELLAKLAAMYVPRFLKIPKINLMSSKLVTTRERIAGTTFLSRSGLAWRTERISILQFAPMLNLLRERKYNRRPRDMSLLQHINPHCLQITRTVRRLSLPTLTYKSSSLPRMKVFVSDVTLTDNSLSSIMDAIMWYTGLYKVSMSYFSYAQYLELYLPYKILFQVWSRMEDVSLRLMEKGRSYAPAEQIQGSIDASVQHLRTRHNCDHDSWRWVLASILCRPPPSSILSTVFSL